MVTQKGVVIHSAIQDILAIAAAQAVVIISAEDVVVITGSLYLIGEARQLFLNTTLGRW